MKADTMTIELPPLPEPTYFDSERRIRFWIDLAMQDYARTAILADRASRSRAASEPGEVARLADEAGQAALHLAASITDTQIDRIFSVYMSGFTTNADLRNAAREIIRTAIQPTLAAVATSPASEAQAGGEAVDTVPWPIVDSFAGGADQNGVAAWLRVRLGDGPETTEFIRKDLVAAFPLEVHTTEQSERVKRYFANQIGVLHPLTLELVIEFTFALGRKLAASERKYGYSDGWASPDWMDECRQHLLQHVAKGDPRDVAAYCAFMWYHGASTAIPSEAHAPYATPGPRGENVGGVVEALSEAALLEALTGHVKGYITDTVRSIAMDVQRACATKWGLRIAEKGDDRG
jgi:hypothetical protein